MKYVITGGRGFIGSNLVEYLKNTYDCEIVVIDNLQYKYRYVPIEDNLVVCDITDMPRLLRDTKGADVMIHLAANTGVIPSIEDPMYDMMMNVKGTLTCLEACRENGIGKFIYASSGAVLGEKKPPLHEEMIPKPISPYGVSKLTGEYYCNAYSNTFGINTVSLRFSNVYGPYSCHKNSLVSKFIKALKSNDRSFPIYGDGLQTRDFIYVSDLVRAIDMVANADITNEVFQLSTYKEYSVLDIVRILSELGLQYLDKTLYLEFEDERPGEVRRSYANNSKIGDMIGFFPEVDLEDGLEKTFKWFMKNDCNQNKE
jgi:UDP-glucose 4-epimerase